MFCGAKYTHHTFTPIIKHLIVTTANKHPGKKSFIDKKGVNVGLQKGPVVIGVNVGLLKGPVVKGVNVGLQKGPVVKGVNVGQQKGPVVKGVNVGLILPCLTFFSSFLPLGCLS